MGPPAWLLGRHCPLSVLAGGAPPMPTGPLHTLGGCRSHRAGNLPTLQAWAGAAVCGDVTVESQEAVRIVRRGDRVSSHLPARSARRSGNRCWPKLQSVTVSLAWRPGPPRAGAEPSHAFLSHPALHPALPAAVGLPLAGARRSRARWKRDGAEGANIGSSAS